MALTKEILAGVSDIIPSGLTESGTYTPKGGSGITVTIEKRPINRNSPLFGLVSLDSTSLEIVLRNNELSGNTPRDGDTITDASSTVYRITSAISQLIGSRHHCACVQHR